MVKFEHSIVINRPVEQVFAFSEDPATFPQWFVGVQEIGFVEGQTVAEGAKVRAVGSVMGKRIETVMTCRAFEANRRVAWEMTQPFAQTSTYLYESVAGGTRVTMQGVAELDGFFKLAAPLIVSAVRRNMDASLHNLKDILEAQSAQ